MNLELKARIIQKYGTQSDFSMVAKQSEPVISRVLRGRRQLNMEERQRWERLLGCKLSELGIQEK